MSALLGISLIPILGWKFYIITLLVPILLIAVANDYGIHMIARYQELDREGKGASMKELSAKITQSLWKPIMLTGITTIAGISALWAHTMIPARQMALVASVGVMFAIFFSLVLLPALLSLLKPQDQSFQAPAEQGTITGTSWAGLHFSWSGVSESFLMLPLGLRSSSPRNFLS